MKTSDLIGDSAGVYVDIIFFLLPLWALEPLLNLLSAHTERGSIRNGLGDFFLETNREMHRQLMAIDYPQSSWVGEDRIPTIVAS